MKSRRRNKPTPADSADPNHRGAAPPANVAPPQTIEGAPLCDDKENPLAHVPENELRSLAPSEGTGVTGSVPPPEPPQPPAAAAP
jgi:hypothetical protein